MALRMRWYVPQRQMFPLMASSISASVGLGFFASSAAADMICPDWQYPHCGTSSSIQAFCTGCDASTESPSIVVIFFSGTPRDRRDARARCLSVDVHRARAAKRHPAPELRARHVQRVPLHPEQRHLRIDINSCGLPIQRKSCAHVLLPQLANYPTTPRHRMEITENPPTSRLLALALWQQFLKCRDALLRAG